MNKYICPTCKTVSVINSVSPVLDILCGKCGKSTKHTPATTRLNAEIGKTPPPTPVPVEPPKPNVDLNKLDVGQKLAEPKK